MEGEKNNKKSMESSQEEVWEGFDKDYLHLEETHKDYCRKVAEIKAMQTTIMAGIASQKKQMSSELNDMKKNKADPEKIQQMQANFKEKCDNFQEMEDVLPHENGVYLKVILGSVNVSLLSKQDKFRYKENYEIFKATLTIISLIISIILYISPPLRVFDAMYQFLVVWYYCTLTIREHILKVNGSRIKGWWITHHFLTTVCAGILLIWPYGQTYSEFRDQFFLFSMFISVVQIAQYYYQKGMLYRLRSLGERRNMDITVEGFQSWMWTGLTFLLPFLFAGYAFQLYNAYTLYKLSLHPACTEWQVPLLSLIFFIIFLGNLWTMAGVIKTKVERSGWIHYKHVLHNKYAFGNSNHSKSQ